MRRIGIEERRARLGVRHHLAAPAPSVVAAARALVAVHATDPASVYLSLQARTGHAGVPAVEDALYEERSLIRMLGMRRTMFVVPVELAPVVQASCTDAIAEQQRRRYLQFIVDSGLGDEAWLDEVAEGAARALAARGEATATELAADEPRLRSQVVMARGKPYEARQNITTWVLFLLAAQGRIVRGRPRGSWTSSQWRWSTAEKWLPGGLDRPAAPAARAELLRHWLAAFGPGTVADLRWWTGWTAGQVKQALAAVETAEVDLDGTPGLVLAGDLDPVAAPPPWVALLPGLDATPMGWTGRDWYLGPHAPALFDRSGNIAPTVWCDGRVVGGWSQRPGGEVVYRLLEDVGAEAAARIEAEASRLAEWIGPVRVVPRFRTPLDRELSG